MLEHLRVIELGQVIAGTFGGMILSDLGADVIKVEPPAGDAGRRSAIYGIGDESAIHLTHNRNKRSIVLDLKTDEGRQVLFDLVRTADAVVENFRPGRPRSPRRGFRSHASGQPRRGAGVRLRVRDGQSLSRPAGLRPDPAGDDRPHVDHGGIRVAHRSSWGSRSPTCSPASSRRSRCSPASKDGANEVAGRTSISRCST